MRGGSGFVTLTGPGLTENVSEQELTTNALWEAVTATPSTRTWHETVKVIDRN